MITANADQFLRQLAGLQSDPARALPRGILMVMPKEFYVETQTARDNVYVETDAEADPGKAARQAEALARLVEAAGVPVKRFAGRPEEPDGVFSNNVFATAPGRGVVGAMYHPVRQPEGDRDDIRAWLEQEQGSSLTVLDRDACVAELTGALIIDRARNVGFCGMSQRVDDAGAVAMHDALGLDLTYRFDLQPDEYHTNVVLSVLAGRACIAVPDAFVDSAVPGVLEQAFPDRCLFLTTREKEDFAANCIALTDRDLFMSARAEAGLRPESRRTLTDWGFRIHATDLSELELAGGSLRCMITELF
ncbi:MAG: arginine deiminase-related protein [Xanthomonadales bacterium]|nr:arginine deiminase-related protein [Xanthomonadales bacterium]